MYAERVSSINQGSIVNKDGGRKSQEPPREAELKLTEANIKHDVFLGSSPDTKESILATNKITKQNAVELMGLPFSEDRPEFISDNEIKQHAERIIGEVTPHLVRGIEMFTRREGLSDDALKTEEKRQAWLWAVKSSKYNAIYFVSRREAKQGEEFVKNNAATIYAIGGFIDTHGGAAPIVNFALHSYVQGFANEPERRVITSKKSVPRTGIQGYDKDTLVVRPGRFLDTEPTTSFETAEEIYDWHDLAHITAASSSNNGFGVRYHKGLNSLTRYYRAITEGEGMQDASGPVFSDGMLFTQLSKSVFEHYEDQKLPDGYNRYSYDQIRQFVAQELFAYLGGDHTILHPGTGKQLKAGRPIDPLELAVCEQNKRYERRAAEVERDIFVRGTPEGSRGNPEKDPFVSLSRSQRILQIAELGHDPVYFEARNLTRHRAHEDALGQFAGYLGKVKREELKGDPNEEDQMPIHEDIQLLDATVDFYQMKDLRGGEGNEINLYQLVGDTIKTRNARSKK
jgi:hypothetical protein